MLRFFRICGISFLVPWCASSGLAQQPSLTPQQQALQQQALQQQTLQQQAQAAAQYQQAMQQQQAMAAQGKEVPTLVMTAEAAIAAGAAKSQAQAEAAAQAKISKVPFEPLNKEQADYLDAVLNAWEQRTGKIVRYQCTITRWQFDPTIEPTQPANIDSGVLQYAKPDKGLYRIDKRQSISKKGPPPEYRVSEKFADYWICDGEYLHVRDRNEKKELKIQLPPEQRGNGIHNSPLPFLFGVKADEIKQRYWIRPVAPPKDNTDVWLEAWPKLLDDAGSYSRVQIILDPKEVLPKGLVVYLPNWEPQHPNREVYEFNNRKQDWNAMDAIREKLFMKEFIELDLPSDWQVIVEPYSAPQDAGQPGQGSPNPTQRVAQPPATQPQMKLR